MVAPSIILTGVLLNMGFPIYEVLLIAVILVFIHNEHYGTGAIN